MPSEPAAKIVVPDDFPPALTGSVAEAPLKKMGQVRVFTKRGADQEATLIERPATRSWPCPSWCSRPTTAA